MATSVGGKEVASKATSHVYLAPPAVSNIPPMTPATPTGVPAPFPYMGQSSTGSGTASKVIIGGDEAIIEGSKVDVTPSPGNSPSQPAPMHDLVTMMVNNKTTVL
jgi:hypothetical protein